MKPSCRHAVTRLALALIVIGVLLRFLAGEVYDPALGSFGLVCAGLGIVVGAAAFVDRLNRFLDGAR